MIHVTMRTARSLAFVLAAGLSTAACYGTVGYRASVPMPSAGIYVETEPPAPRVEYYDPRPGYVFIQGRWNWQGGQWVWGSGRWERERSGYYYEPGRWDHRGRNYVWVDGRWNAGGGGGGGGVIDHREPVREERREEHREERREERRDDNRDHRHDHDHDRDHR